MIQKLPAHRISEFDVIRLFAIFLVLWNHSILHLSSSDRYANGVFVFISTFNMPLFMLVSGFFAPHSMTLSFTELLRKKFWQLLYPCLSFGVLFLFVEYGWKYFDSKELVVGNFMRGLYEIFWFLKSTFLCYIILYVSLKLSPNVWLGGGIALIISQMFPVFKMSWMFPFFLTGYVMSLNWAIFKKNLVVVLICSLLAFIGIFFYVDIGDSNIMTTLKHRLTSGDVSAFGDLMGVQLYRYAVGLSGSLLALSALFIAMKKIKNIRIVPILARYGKETLGIYILQTLILEIIAARILKLSEVNLTVFTYIVAPLFSLFILGICLFLLRCIRESSTTYKLLFGTQIKK